MATRIRSNNQGGTTTDSPLLAAATTFNSAELAVFPDVTGTDYAYITLNPESVGGIKPEIVKITAHAHGATSATIVRAADISGNVVQVGTQYPAGTKWWHTPTQHDFEDELADGTTIVSSAGKLKVNTDGVGANEIAAGAVGVAELNSAVAGAGLVGGAGAALDVNADAVTLEVATDVLRIKDAGVVAAKIAAGAVTRPALLSNTQRSVTDMVTNSTTTITSATAVFTVADVGAEVTGTNIPTNTKILTYVGPTSVTLSQAATGSGSGGSLKIWGHGFSATNVEHTLTIPTSPHEGEQWWQADLQRMWVWTNGAWALVSGGACLIRTSANTANIGSSATWTDTITWPTVVKTTADDFQISGAQFKIPTYGYSDWDFDVQLNWEGTSNVGSMQTSILVNATRYILRSAMSGNGDGMRVGGRLVVPGLVAGDVIKVGLAQTTGAGLHLDGGSVVHRFSARQVA